MMAVVVEDHIENLLQRRPLNSSVTDTVNTLCGTRILKSTWLLRSPATSAAFILTLAERLVPMVWSSGGVIGEKK